MIIYITLYLFILFGVIIYDINGKKKYKNEYLALLFFLFAIIVGIRYYIGDDTIIYTLTYDKYPNIVDLGTNAYKEYGYNPGWIIFMSLCRTISDSFLLPQLIIASFFYYGLYNLFKAYSLYPFWGLVIFFTSISFVTLSFEFLRQSFAITIFMFSIKYYKKNKWARYYLLSITALMFHFSALILFLFPFLKIFRNISFVKLVIITTICIFAVVLLKQYFTYLPLLLSLFMSGGNSLSKISDYIQGGSKITYNIYFYLYAYISYIIMPLIFIFISKKLTNYQVRSRELILGYFILSALAGIQSEAYRLNLFLLPIIVLEMANLMMQIIKRFKQKTILILILPIILNINYPYFLFAGKFPRYIRYYPYKSFFLRNLTQEDQIRIQRVEYKHNL